MHIPFKQGVLGALRSCFFESETERFIPTHTPPYPGLARPWCSWTPTQARRAHFYSLIIPLPLCVCVCVCVCVQSCLTLHDPVDCSLPGSSAHGILQARILEWAAISSSSRPPQSRDQTRASCISCIGRQVFFLPLGPLGKPPALEKPAKTVGISTLPSGIPSAQKDTGRGQPPPLLLADWSDLWSLLQAGLMVLRFSYIWSFFVLPQYTAYLSDQ